MVCVLLLDSVPLADAAQNSNGSNQTPSTEKTKENKNQNVDSTPTLEKTQSSKVDSSATPSSTPKADKANTGKEVDPQTKVPQKSAKSVKPARKKSAKSDQSDTGNAKTDFKKNSRDVKDGNKAKDLKEEKLPKTAEKRPEKVMATFTSEPVNKAEDSTPTPDVSVSPSSQTTGLSAEIEKSDGNRATLVVSGVKEGTKLKVVITSKDAKKK
ncbi:MAG: hypothetical protein Q8K86_01905 [Candidatus Nanopelagicaceae bacterium]|nr:hypothetical protein [Candidatus Nanopelagicaceae bacterium]